MPTKKVADWKKEEIKDIKEMVKDKKVIGVINIENLPSSQFQAIKKKLRGKTDIKITKSNLILRAFEELKDDNLNKLIPHINGPCGLIVSTDNPFQLFNFLKKNRTKVPPKPGMVAHEDFVASAGDTDLLPGPDLADLKSVGVKARIERGKITVAEDSVVVKKGEVVSTKAAGVLAKLGVTPREIGIEVNALMEDGFVYTSDVLNVDEEELIKQIQDAYLYAMNLSVNLGIFNKASIEFMVQKAYNNALAIAVEGKIFTKETLEQILAKAGLSADALAGILKQRGYT
jgi:large subunit ribosomal protein L10